MEYLLEGPHFYLNESERNINVHVWSSLVKPCSSSNRQFNGKPTLGLVLIAGLHVEDNDISVSLFYEWLFLIMELQNGDCQNIILFPCQDPRLLPNLISESVIQPGPNSKPLRPHGVIMMEKGHYMLYLCKRENNGTFKYHGFWPKLVPGNFYKRNQSASSEGPSEGPNKLLRDTKTRDHVRMRDRRCLMTGQAAVVRSRGGNFTGLEVAHIFPLKGVGKSAWVDIMAADAQDQVKTDADTPQNAMLLRADIHTLFDDYQWSLWPVGDSKTLRVVRFEKSGAKVLDNYDKVITLGPGLGRASPPSVALLKEHFRVALLMHFKGFGKRPIAGFQSTLLD